MKQSLDQLLDILFSKSEQMEEDLKKQSAIEELSVKQLQCLELIVKMKNPSLSELSEGLKITKPSVTAMIDKLEKLSYVERVQSDTDRRSAHVHLTSKGITAAQLHNKLHCIIAQKLTSSLTDSEKDILIVLLAKAIKSFK